MEKEIHIPSAVLPSVIKEDAWLAGSSSKIEWVDRKVKWRDYTSRPECQKIGFETYSCVTYSALNCIETVGNYKIEKKEFSESGIKWLKDNGYLNDQGKLDFSDREIAILSGTTKEGNSIEAVAECIRKKGLIPDRDLPMGGKNFEQYHDKKLITEYFLKKGEEFLKRFEIRHDWILTQSYFNKSPVQVLSYYTLNAPIQCAAPICPGWNNTKVKSCPATVSEHATTTLGVFSYYDQLDQYDPYFKELALDYPLMWGKRYDIVEKIIVNPETKEALPNYPEDAPLPPLTPEPLLVRLWHKLLANYYFNKFAGGLFIKK